MSGTFRGGEQLHLVRPAGGGRDERDPVLVRRHHPGPGPLGGDDVGEQVAAGAFPVPPSRREDLLPRGGQVGIAVDLAVGVGQRHPDLFAMVLEGEDVLDALDRPQRRRPVGPHVDHQPGALGPQVGEDPVVLVGEADDLAAPEPGTELGHRVARRTRRDVELDTGGQRREPVLEDDDLVVALGDLGRPAGPGRHQRALVGRRQEGAGLPMRGDGHPLPQQRVVAQLRAGGDGGQIAGVDGVPRDGLVVEVEDLSAVGQATTRPDHGATLSLAVDHRANRPGNDGAPGRMAGGSRAV